MNIRRARKAIRKVARNREITEKQVVEEIEKEILETIHRIQEEGDAVSMAQWRKIPSAGAVPTV